MKATDLTPKQRSDVIAAVAGRRDYFRRMRKRMDTVGWDKTDASYVAFDAAQAVVHAVHVSAPPVPRQTWAERGTNEPTDLGLKPLPPMPWVGKPKGRKRR